MSKERGILQYLNQHDGWHRIGASFQYLTLVLLMMIAAILVAIWHAIPIEMTLHAGRCGDLVASGIIDLERANERLARDGRAYQLKVQAGQVTGNLGFAYDYLTPDLSRQQRALFWAISMCLVATITAVISLVYRNRQTVRKAVLTCLGKPDPA